MSNKEKLAAEKAARIHEIIDTASAALANEGVKYFLGVVDKNPKAPDGGKVYASSDIKGNDFIYILDVAMPTTQDISALGIHVGQLISARLRKPQTVKGS